jgi:trans-aconitate methyltransferase
MQLEEKLMFWERYQQKYKGGDYGYHWGGEKVLQIVSDLCAPIVKGKRVLEIGGGGGKWTKALFDRMGAEYVISTDIHDTAIKAIKAHEPRADVYKTDGKGIKLKGKWDLVFTYDVFLHLPQSLVMRYLLDAVKVSDEIIFQLPDLNSKVGSDLFLWYAQNDVFNDPYNKGYMNFYTKDQVESMAEKAGGKLTVLGEIENRDLLFHVKFR